METIIKNQDIIYHAKEFSRGLLGKRDSESMCFVVTWALAGYLQSIGEDCSLTEGHVYHWHHYWITLSDGRIIDATADQFIKEDETRLPNLFVVERPDWYEPLDDSDKELLSKGFRRMTPRESRAAKPFFDREC